MPDPDVTVQLPDEELPSATAPAAAPAPLMKTLMSETKQLGLESAGANPGQLFATTVHDIRGGGLSLLLARLQFAHQDGWKTESARTYRLRREFPHWLNLPEIRPLILGATHPHALNTGSVRLILRRIR